MSEQFMLRYVSEQIQRAAKEEAKQLNLSQNAFILQAINWCQNNKNRYRYEDVWGRFNIFQEDAKTSKKFIIRFDDAEIPNKIKDQSDFHLRSVNSELNIMIMTYLHHISLQS